MLDSTAENQNKDNRGKHISILIGGKALEDIIFGENGKNIKAISQEEIISKQIEILRDMSLEGILRQQIEILAVASIQCIQGGQNKGEELNSLTYAMVEVVRVVHEYYDKPELKQVNGFRAQSIPTKESEDQKPKNQEEKDAEGDNQEKRIHDIRPVSVDCGTNVR